jgi:hypothetical protein
MVSAFNASIDLARKGYTQEIGVLLRTLVECSTHIEYVVEPYTSEGHRLKAKKYVEEYFADSERVPFTAISREHIKQKTVHAALGKALDDFAKEIGAAEHRLPAAELYSNSYRILSNYVHARYPEAIDLFGGQPGQFHTKGMGGTPKDLENVAILETFARTVETAKRRMIQGLNLWLLIEADPVVFGWYKKTVINPAKSS